MLWMESKLWPGMQSHEHGRDEADRDPSDPETNRCQDCETERRRERERTAMGLTKTVVSGPRGALGAASTGVRPTRHADWSISTSMSESRCALWRRGTRPKQQLQKEHECPFLLYSRLEVAQLRREAPQRPKQNTRSTLVSTLRPSARADLSKTTTRAEAGQSNKHAEHVSEHAAHKQKARQWERRARRDGQTSTTRNPSCFEEHQREDE